MKPNLAFWEFSGSQERNDPLEDFSGYLNDPINWDWVEPSEPQLIYRTHTGFITKQQILKHTSLFRFGLKTMMEQAQVYSTPQSHLPQTGSEQHQNLIDAVITPYVHVESQPLSWVRIIGNFQLNLQAFDIQNACQNTCSQEPKGRGSTTIPSFKAGILFEPWIKTKIFLTLRKGFYQFDAREPIGSTAAQQINRTRFFEFRFWMNSGNSLEFGAALWGTKNGLDFVYNFEDEKFEAQGPSQ